jgi:hypothetical protein
MNMNRRAIVCRGLIMLRASAGIVLLAWPACSSQQFGTPTGVSARTYWREVYHTSPLTYRGGYNMLVPCQVWSSNPLLAYDPSFAGYEYRGERDTCGIEPFAMPAASVSYPQYALVEDSGWIVTQMLPGNPNEIAHADGLRLFNAFYVGFDSVVPVFEVPRMIQLPADGMYGWRGVLAIAYEGGDLFPSVWLNTRELEKAIIQLPATSKPYSTLAHEMAHILLDPVNPPGVVPLVWDDNSTPFLHIQTHIGWVRQYRTSVSGPAPVTTVTANDVNRRNLIAYGPDDACDTARFASIRFVRPVFP